LEKLRMLFDELNGCQEVRNSANSRQKSFGSFRSAPGMVRSPATAPAIVVGPVSGDSPKRLPREPLHHAALLTCSNTILGSSPQARLPRKIDLNVPGAETLLRNRQLEYYSAITQM
ncbi:MAG: hypothetical protein WC100_19765, partial [Sterolibacterium sp.]